MSDDSDAVGHTRSVRRLNNCPAACTIWYMRFDDSIDINATAATVWDVYADVEHWPDWTASVRSVTFVAGDHVAIGARARIAQPKLPKAEWEVTEVEPGRSWTWVASAPGVRTTAIHRVEPLDDGSTRVTQTLIQEGALGWLIARVYAGLTRRYLRMEAEGLAARCEARTRS